MGILRPWMLLALALLLWATLPAAGKTHALDNAVLRVDFDTSSGTFSCARKDGLGFRIPARHVVAEIEAFLTGLGYRPESLGRTLDGLDI